MAKDANPDQMVDIAEIHATCVAVDGVGVLLCGPSGSGKSDLALRLIDDGAFLIADDLTRLVREGDALVALAPEHMAGQIEARGLGIVAVPHVQRARLVLIVDLVEPDAVERLPESRAGAHFGLAVPLIRVNAFEASAPAKVRLAVAQGGRDSAAQSWAKP